VGRSLLVLTVSLVICLGAGWAGSLLTRPAVLSDWYEQLAKPAWTPSGWLIASVWRTLFALMGLSLWMVWMQRSASPRRTRPALVLFAVQLLLNVAWSYFFFALKRPGAALIEICVLWIAILATIVACWRVRPAPAVLMLPYLAWVGFAAFLNGAIWRLNSR